MQLSLKNINTNNPMPLQLYSLRGGGCGSSKILVHEPKPPNEEIMPSDFLKSLGNQVQIIADQSLYGADKLAKEEVMRAIQWIHQKQELLQDLNSTSLLSATFDLVKQLLISLLKSSITYMKTNGVICLYVLQICTQLSKPLFTYYTNNPSRPFDPNDLEQLKNSIQSLEYELEQEGENLWKVGIQFELEMIKAVVENIPTDKGKKIASKLLQNLFESIINREPTMDLLSSLIDLGEFLINKIIKQALKEKYERYYYMEFLKWYIIKLMGKQISSQQILQKLKQTYKQYIFQNDDWMLHYMWIRLLGDLITYKPTISKEQFRVISEQNFIENWQLLWDEMIQRKMIMPLINKKEAILEIDGQADIQNKDIEQIILPNLYQGKKQLFLLQKYLLTDVSRYDDFQLLSDYVLYGLKDTKNQQLRGKAIEIQQDQEQQKELQCFIKLFPFKQIQRISKNQFEEYNFQLEKLRTIANTNYIITTIKKISPNEKDLLMFDIENDINLCLASWDKIITEQLKLNKLVQFVSHLIYMTQPIDDSKLGIDSNQSTKFIKYGIKLQSLYEINSSLIQIITSYLHNKNQTTQQFNDYNLYFDLKSKLETKIQGLSKEFQELKVLLSIISDKEAFKSSSSINLNPELNKYRKIRDTLNNLQEKKNYSGATINPLAWKMSIDSIIKPYQKYLDQCFSIRENFVQIQYLFSMKSKIEKEQFCDILDQKIKQLFIFDSNIDIVVFLFQKLKQLRKLSFFIQTYEKSMLQNETLKDFQNNEFESSHQLIQYSIVNQGHQRFIQQYVNRFYSRIEEILSSDNLFELQIQLKSLSSLQQLVVKEFKSVQQIFKGSQNIIDKKVQDQSTFIKEIQNYKKKVLDFVDKIPELMKELLSIFDGGEKKQQIKRKNSQSMFSNKSKDKESKTKLLKKQFTQSSKRKKRGGVEKKEQDQDLQKIEEEEGEGEGEGEGQIEDKSQIGKEDEKDQSMMIQKEKQQEEVSAIDQQESQHEASFCQDDNKSEQQFTDKKIVLDQDKKDEKKKKDLKISSSESQKNSKSVKVQVELNISDQIQEKILNLKKNLTSENQEFFELQISNIKNHEKYETLVDFLKDYYIYFDQFQANYSQQLQGDSIMQFYKSLFPFIKKFLELMQYFQSDIKFNSIYFINFLDQFRKAINEFKSEAYKIQERDMIDTTSNMSKYINEKIANIFEVLEGSENLLQKIQNEINKVDQFLMQNDKTYNQEQFDFLKNQLQTLGKQIGKQELKELFKKKDNINHQTQQSYFKLNDFVEIVMISLESQQFNFKIEEQHKNTNIIEETSDKWKVREAVVMIVLTIQNTQTSNNIKRYCSNLLIEVWKYEKNAGAKQFLKNKELLTLQAKLITQDWQNHQEKLQSHINEKLEHINKLQKEILQEGQLDSRLILQKQMEQEYLEIDEQIENISDMAQSMSIVITFLKEIKQDLAKVQASIAQLKNQIEDVAKDVKYLRGKTYQQLFEIRKKQILIEAGEQQLYKIYVDLKLSEISLNNKVQDVDSNLITENLNNSKFGDFLRHRYDVMLIHGQAGSGKSVAARRMEYIIWKQHEANKSLDSLNFIPLYISLPSLQEPRFNIVEEILSSSSYNFNQLQIQELKEAVNNNQVKLLLILDSYDELKSEFIQQNLYHTNSLDKVWKNPKVVFTTRSEVFKENYRNWFVGKQLDKDYFLELSIKPFNQNQQQEYLRQYCSLGLKLILYELFKFLSDLSQSQQNVTIMNRYFIAFWEKFESDIVNQQQEENQNQYLLSQNQISDIIKYCRNDKVYKMMNEEQQRNIQIQIGYLWSQNMYRTTISNINLESLLLTPFLMEIVVKVLPIMIEKYSDKSRLKQIICKNLLTLKLNFSEERKQNQKTLEQDAQNQISDIWNQLNKNSFINDFRLGTKVTVQENFLIMNSKKYSLSNERDAKLIVRSLEQKVLSQFDFYEEFVEYYHNSQIEKYRQMGNQFNYEILKIDFMNFASNLANQMTKHQLTQVQYQNIGKLQFDNYVKQSSWIDQFFDDSENGDYKKLIRSGILLTQKGNMFSFTHKSIQEFLVAKTIYKLFNMSDFNNGIFESLIKIFRIKLEGKKKKVEKFVDELKKKDQYNELIKYIINSERIQQEYAKKKRLKTLEFEISKLIEYFFQLEQSLFQKIYLSQESYLGACKFLCEKVANNENIISMLVNIVKLTSITTDFLVAGSNAIYLLNMMRFYFGRQDWSEIEIEKTKLDLANFALSDLSGSIFRKVSINGCNFNGCILRNVKWSKLKINELRNFIDEENSVKSMALSPDSETIVTGIYDNQLCVWKTQKESYIKKFKAHDFSINSIVYSQDGFMLASGSSDKLIKIWDTTNWKEKFNLQGHTLPVMAVCFAPNNSILVSGSRDSTIRIWSTKDGSQISAIKPEIPKQRAVLSLAISPDSTTLVAGYRNGTVDLRDLISKQKIHRFEEHFKEVYALAFSPDGLTFCSGGRDKKIKVCDIQSKQSILLKGHKALVSSLDYSPDGSMIASTSGDETVRLWDIKNQKEISTLNGHTGEVSSVQFSSDGGFLVSGSLDGSVRLWDVSNQQDIQSLQGHKEIVMGLAISPDESTIASCGEDKEVNLWDIFTGKLISTFSGHSEVVRSILYAEDGQNLISGDSDGWLIRWDIHTTEQLYKNQQFSSEVLHMVLSPNNSYLIVSFKTQAIVLFSEQLSFICNLKKFTERDPYNPISFNQSDNHIAFSENLNKFEIDEDGKTQNEKVSGIVIYDVKKKCKINSIETKKKVICLCYTLNEKYLAWSSKERDLVFFDLQQQKQHVKLELDSQCYEILFSQNDKLMFLLFKGEIQIRNIMSKEIQNTLKEPESSISSMSISLNGNYFIYSYKTAIKLWSIKQNNDNSQVNFNEKSQSQFRIIKQKPICYQVICKEQEFQAMDSIIVNASITYGKSLNLATLFIQKGANIEAAE